MKITTEQKVELTQFEIDHEGHALATLLLYDGRFRHNDTHGWLKYNGKFWESEGSRQTVERAITYTLKKRRGLFAEKEEMKKARFCMGWRTTVANTGMMIAKMEGVYTPISWFDKPLDMLNVNNGVINLRTGELSPHDKAQLFTYCLPVDYLPDEEAPKEWLGFLDSVGLSDDVVSYLQIAVGYSLTGFTSEEVMFYLHGETRSGKGTFTEVINHMIGDLSTGISMETFTSKRMGDTSKFDLAPLKMKRFVTASESTENGKLNPATIKSVTGGDEIYCSFKRKDHFSYRPQFKIWLTSNFPVNVDVDDDAAWGRLRVIRFNNSFLGKEDKTLKDRLKEPKSLEKILKWAVDGARDWFVLKTTGLPLPKEVEAAVKEHRLLLDGIGQFIDQDCELGDAFFIEGKVLYKEYKAWAEDEGHYVVSRKKFTQSLSKKGILSKPQKVKKVNKRGYVGIQMRTSDDVDDIPV